MAPDHYAVRLLTRCRIEGRLHRVGTCILVPLDKLRVAAHLVRTGAARPADERTARDVELHQRLAAALPR